MAIAQALKSRGHDVAVYSGGQVRKAFEREDFRFFPFKRVDEAGLKEMLLSERATLSPLLHPRRRVTILKSWLVDTLSDQIADQTEVLRAWQPDAIVSDVTMWGVPLILKHTQGVPVAVSTFVPGCMIAGPDAPPFGLGLPLPHNLPTRLLSKAVKTITGAAARSLRGQVNKIRHLHGLSPLPCDVQTFLGNMELYLVPCTPQFDYSRRDLPDSVRYVGDLVWNKHSSDPPPDWLARLPTDRAIVHVTEGTMHSRPFVLQAAAEGLAHRNMYVVMTSGRDRDPESLNLPPLAPNIRIESWVPHSDLLPRTDVMVTTGGGGTIVAGLQAGVPMVVVPTQWDKPDNAQRVVEAGVGLRIGPRRCTPQRLRDAVEHILGNESFREKAKLASSAMRSYGGPARAAVLIEEMLNHRSSDGVG